MTKYTAKKTGFILHDKYQNVVEYEYRGQKYDVRYPVANSMSIPSAKIQHEDAQARIDKMLDKKGEGQAIDINEIWAMYEF